MNELKKIINQAQDEFLTKLDEIKATGGMTQERYIRFLSMQYHLTKGVQKHFMAVAGHHYMAKRRSFREFLVNFANEEELHYLLAEKDLKNLGTTPLPINFDTELWWSYFNSIIHERPFVRVGGTCILENIAGKSGAVIADLLGEASYLTPKNTTFVVVHQHEELPHGDEILEAVANARLDETMQSDLLEGAKKALTLYLRMFNWAMLPDNG